MFSNREREMREKVWPVAIGATVGLATGLLLWRGAIGGRRLSDLGTNLKLRRLEQRVVATLSADGVLGTRAIEVAALAPGIIELTGTVQDEQEADHAVAVVQRVTGVRTVLNRLDMGEVGVRTGVRGRRSGGPSAMKWYGGLVGMGQRRQGRAATGRHDVAADMKMREMGVDRAVELSSEPLEKAPNAVEGHSTATAGPSDRGKAAKAYPNHVPADVREPSRNENPAAGVHQELKPGTELTIEAAGLEGNLDAKKPDRKR